MSNQCQTIRKRPSAKWALLSEQPLPLRIPPPKIAQSRYSHSKQSYRSGKRHEHGKKTMNDQGIREIMAIFLKMRYKVHLKLRKIRQIYNKSASNPRDKPEDEIVYLLFGK